MLKLLVIADDFTGALDTGVQFSSQGIPTLVSTEIEVDYLKVAEEIQVLVLNSESRHLSFDKAYEKTKKILVEAKAAGISHIYKKVDSALRGNISAEIKAILETCDQETIPFLPAYPEMNRILQEGQLYIDGVLASESIFGDDPYEPVKESNVLTRLKNEAGIQATLITDSNLPQNAKGVCVFDAQKEETLVAQGKLLKERNLLKVTVGCAGFAKVLAKQLFPQPKAISYQLKNPVVVVCGSVNPITKKQIEYVEQKNYPRISLSAFQLLEANYWKTQSGQAEINRYLELMDRQPLLVFETFSDQTTKEIETLRKEKKLTATECRFRIGESLGKLTEELWQQHQNNTFLFTGGDTLFQSMNVLGITGIKPMVEISPGVVLSAIEWNNREMQVITKSGGFGEETLFEEISMV